MGQEFEYPNLISGTRSGKGWNLASGAPACVDTSVREFPVLTIANSASTETYLYSAPVALSRGTYYVLSFLAASTDNVRGFDVHVLDMANPSYDSWIGAEMYPALPGGGGSLVLPAVPPLGEVARQRVVQNPLRQQREHGRRGIAHMVRERHALRRHGAPCLGAGCWGGVALDE